VFPMNSPRPMSKTLRVLAALLAYPDAQLRTHVPEMRHLLVDEAAVSPPRRAELDALMDFLQCGDPLEAEAAYVELFDRSRAASLHLFEHVHGDSRDRGPAMIDLGQTYEKAGLVLAPGELPDYLPAVIVHILNAIFGALCKRDSAYASVVGALIELAGEKAQPVEPAADETLDESWAEPPVFDGCSAKGQAKPGQPQPVHVVRSLRATGVNANPGSGGAP
jgi:nitrate reductase delta subunit